MRLVHANRRVVVRLILGKAASQGPGDYAPWSLTDTSPPEPPVLAAWGIGVVDRRGIGMA